MSNLETLKSQLEDFELDCEYWDVRVEQTVETEIFIDDGDVTTCNTTPSLGAFLRVRKGGFWRYKSTTDLSSFAESLTELASARSFGSNPTEYLARKQQAFCRLTPDTERVDLVPIDQKLEVLNDFDGTMAAEPLIVARRVKYKDTYKVKSFLNGSSTEFEYDFNQCGAIFSFDLKDDSNKFNDFYRTYGAQLSELSGYRDGFRKFIDDSKEFLNAPAVEPGNYRVILDPEVAGVFTHESFGHRSEADFMLGNPESIKEWELGKKLASDCLNIVDAGGLERTSGYCPIDDEGTPAKKNYLIKNGVLTGRLHSRETAHALDEQPTGNSRAINFEFEPIVRMTSTFIEPGERSIEQILPDLEGSLMVQGVKHGSGLSTFTIAPTRGYWVKENGQLDPVRLSVISGSVFETLSDIEEVSSDYNLISSAIGGCGKMDQWPMPVSDGGPYVVISKMQVS